MFEPVIFIDLGCSKLFSEAQALETIIPDVK